LFRKRPGLTFFFRFEANEIGNAGFKAIVQALASNTTLTSVDLGDNLVTGASPILDLSDCLKVNTTITKLYLDCMFNSY